MPVAKGWSSVPLVSVLEFPVWISNTCWLCGPERQRIPGERRDLGTIGLERLPGETRTAHGVCLLTCPLRDAEDVRAQIEVGRDAREVITDERILYVARRRRESFLEVL